MGRPLNNRGFFLNDKGHLDSNKLLNKITVTTTFNEADATPPTEAWVASTAYVVGDEILQAGTAYRCTADHTSGKTFSKKNWKAYDIDGGAETAYIVKQTGYNKYLVQSKADENVKAIVRLEDPTKEGGLLIGEASMAVTVDSETKYVRKLVKNIMELFGEEKPVSYKFELTYDAEGEVSGGAFKTGEGLGVITSEVVSEEEPETPTDPETP